MLRVSLLFTFLVVAFSASLFAEDKPKTVAEKLIGKWKLVKSGEELPEGVAATLELMKEGKVKLNITFMGKTQLIDGTYRLEDGEKLKVVMKVEEMEKTQIMKIEKLTEDELITIDEKNKKDEFKRVKEEKKEDKK